MMSPLGVPASHGRRWGDVSSIVRFRPFSSTCTSNSTSQATRRREWHRRDDREKLRKGRWVQAAICSGVQARCPANAGVAALA